MGRLASQTAANKLGQILGLLVIPIIVLWSMYYFHAKTEIDLLAREIDGASLALLAIAPLEPPKTQSDADQLEAAIGFSPRKSATWDIATKTNAAANASYLKDVFKSSGLALDGETESNALAETGLELVPSLLQKLSGLVSTLEGFGSAGESSRPDPNIFLLAAADARLKLEQIEDSLSVTRAGQSKDVVAAVQSLQKTTGAMEELARDLDTPLLSGIDKAGRMRSLATAQKQLLQDIPAAFQVPVLQALKSRLETRHVNAWRNLILLTMAGAASALAGIGLAVLMMRSTLVRLDEVEHSRAEAHEARRDAEQMSLRFSTINNDISNLNQELAVKVKALKDAQDELIKKGRLEQLGQLTATIAHEIRNPLGAIRTSAFLLERKTAKLGGDLAGHLQRINNGVNRCDTIISQLLDFSRTKEVNSSLLQLDEWLAKVVREEAQRLPENIYIECSLGLDDMKVAFDPARLQRAIINLLNNACEALSQQDVQERLDGQHACIWVTTLVSGDYATIRISDNGPGIASEFLQKIREPLFTTKSFGTGLGIPAVEQIVAQHGGRLDISSEVGSGAVFSISLPLNRPREMHHAA